MLLFFVGVSVFFVSGYIGSVWGDKCTFLTSLSFMSVALTICILGLLGAFVWLWSFIFALLFARNGRGNKLVVDVILFLAIAIAMYFTHTPMQSEKPSPCYASTFSFNRAAFEIFSQLEKDNPNKNILLGASSVERVFGALCAGADKKTANLISRKFFGLSDSQKLISELGKLSFGSSRDLSLYNDLIKDSKKTFFRSLCFYNPTLDDISDDFKKTLLELGASLKGGNSLVATFAIIARDYFNATWKEPFDKSQTLQKDFYTSDGQKTIATFMSKKISFAKTVIDQDERIRALRLKFKDESMSMVLVMRNDNNKTPITDTFNVSEFEDMKSRFAETTSKEVYVELPKFKMKDKRIDFTKMLIDKGIDLKNSFTKIYADGKPLSRPLEIKSVADFEIDETGARFHSIAIVTALSASFAEPFIANKPFLFFIVDDNAEHILLMGKFANPTED